MMLCGGVHTEALLLTCRAAASRRGAPAARPGDRAKREQQVREQQAAAQAVARRDTMAAAAEARMRALSVASEQQQLW